MAVRSFLLWTLVLAFSCGVLGKDTVQGIKQVRDQLLIAAKMPEESQKVLLNVLGASLVATNQWDCNLFGGESGCVAIPNDSKFAKTCAFANKKVDCAFQSEAFEEISRDPHDVMREKLAKEGFPPCDSCFDALHNFWCGQTVPTCGTFEDVLDEILPVINEAVNGKANPVDSLQKAVPKMLDAFSLGLPCREMCEAITSTCSCGRSTTFGQVMSILEKRRDVEDGLASFSTNMSTSTAKSLFASVWNKPVCSLFAPKSMPGFVGICEVGSAASTRCGWCKSKVRGPQDAEAQMVAQIAESVSGMMQAGLQKILDTASSSLKKSSHGKEWSWEEESHHKKASGGWGVALTVFLVLLLGGAGGYAAWYIYKKRQITSHSYMDLNNLGYNPPVL